MHGYCQKLVEPAKGRQGSGGWKQDAEIKNGKGVGNGSEVGRKKQI